MLELLSPAASPEAVIAAVQSGADSIYIRFGGGGSAGFSEDDFMKAVRYCRVRACRVYAELDTALWDGELEAAERLAKSAAEVGVSAMVLQDIGLASVLHEVTPELPLHAGERLGFHNLAGVEAAAQLGFSRVRLPAETSLREISFLAASATIELEVAVQRELCFSRAGCCHMGALTERRSAIRGDCSRLCREKYSLGGRMDDERPICLSDACLLEHLRELTAAGVTCVRIGDCAAKPELTALVTGIYSRCIREDRLPSPGETEQLDYAFEHRGFTDGYLTGKRDDMFGAAPEPSGDSKKVLAEARRGYEDSEARRVPVEFYALIKAGAETQFAVRDTDGNNVVLSGERPIPSAVSLTQRDIESVLYKTGGTPYSCFGVRVIADAGLTLAEGETERLRRELLRELTEKRAKPTKTRFGTAQPLPRDKGFYGGQTAIFQVMSAEQLIPELAELKPDYVYLPLEVAVSDFDRLEPFITAGVTPVAVLPAIITDAEAGAVFDLLTRARALGISQALVENLGHVALVRRADMSVRGGAELPFWNSRAMQSAQSADFLSVTAPFELRMEQIKELCKPVNTEMIVYGRLPVMLTDHCVIKRSAERCSCSTPGRLSDNKGAVYPVMRDFGCRNIVLSANKVFLADKREDFSSSGLWGMRLSFTTESARECVEVAKSFMGLSDYRPNGLTRGLYYRGVE
ncbi:MAG: DUF3656 domain-containing protein [Oscillospiraceae bacterium]